MEDHRDVHLCILKYDISPASLKISGWCLSLSECFGIHLTLALIKFTTLHKQQKKREKRDNNKEVEKREQKKREA